MFTRRMRASFAEFDSVFQVVSKRGDFHSHSFPSTPCPTFPVLDLHVSQFTSTVIGLVYVDEMKDVEHL